eukprot:1625544-Pyramimonas_sp.AAC.1
MAVETKGDWLFRAGTGNVIGADLCLDGVQQQTARGKLSINARSIAAHSSAEFPRRKMSSA